MKKLFYYTECHSNAHVSTIANMVFADDKYHAIEYFLHLNDYPDKDYEYFREKIAKNIVEVKII
jgi:hypothetical protein